MTENRRQGHYVHGLSYTRRERLVGAFILAGGLAVLGLVAVNITATHLLEDRVVFNGYLQNGEGIDANTKVRVAGIEAGKVSSIDITNDNRVHVKLFVYKRFQSGIRSDAVATVNRLAVLGAPAIDISSGKRGAPELASGSTIQMRETMSLDQVMESFAGLLQASRAGGHEALLANLSGAVANLKTITDRVVQGKGAAGMLLYDEAFKQQLLGAMDSLQQVTATASARLAEMKPLVRDGKDLVGSLKTATSDVPALVADLRATTGQAQQTLTLVNDQMQQLPDFMVRADLLLRDANQLIDALEKIWPVSTALQHSREGAEGMIRPQAAHD